jgi:gliding motility-associated-like protein
MNLDLEFLKCDQSTVVEWNEYENWDGGVSAYVIYGAEDGSPLLPIDTVPGDQSTYVHEGVTLGVQYVYLVKALSVNGFKPSISPRTEIFTAYPEIPEFTYLANVNVLGPSAIELKALVEPAAEGTLYRFEKLDRFGEEYESIGIREQSQSDLDGFLTLIDFDTRPGDRIYDYRVSVIDSCGNISSVSDTSSNIRARVSINATTRENYISWSPYKNWDGGVLQYNIYQVNDGVIGPLLGVVPPNIYYFEHLVDSPQDYIRDAQYCYLVEAVEGLNTYGLPQLSNSNLTCGTQTPLIFIPNAITPNGDGLNDTFAPVAGYFDRVDGYSLTIYDRWGALIYETDNYYRAWKAEDGNGNVQEGVYVYHVKFRTGDGQLFERYGDITVIIPESE